MDSISIQELTLNQIQNEASFSIAKAKQDIFSQQQETDEKKPKRSKNDIKDIRSFKQLEKVNLDVDSPRFLQACNKLGISPKECMKKKKEEFVQRGVDEDVIELRYKHFQSRLIDTINRVLQERRAIKIKQMQKEILEQKLKHDTGLGVGHRSKSQSGHYPAINHSYKQQNSSGVLLWGQQNPEVLSTAGVTQANNTSMSKHFLKSLKTQSILGTTLNGTEQQSFSQTARQPFVRNNTSVSPHNLKFLITKSLFREINRSSIDQSNQPNGSITTMNNTMTLMNQSLYNNNGSQTQRLEQHPLIREKMKMEINNIEKSKNMKLAKIKRELEREEDNQKKLQEFEDRLKKAQEKSSQAISQLQSQLKSKNNLRQRKVQQRIDKIAKKHEDEVNKEIERQNDSMSLTVAKQLQIEKEKREEMRLRDENYKEKMKQLEDWRLDRENQQLIELEIKLESIENKLSRSQLIHQNHLERISNQAHAKNETARQKGALQKEVEELKLKEQQDKFDKQQQKIKKKLRDAHWELSQLYEEYKKSKTEKYTANNQKRSQEYTELNNKFQQLKERFDTALEIQEEFKREQQHEFMLKNELRRLKSEDIRQLRERQKRLEFQKKIQILTKEKEHEDFIKHIKSSEQILLKKKLEVNVKKIKEAMDIQRTIQEVSNNNKILTPRSQERLKKEGIILKERIKRKTPVKEQSSYNFNDMYVYNYKDYC